ncbi:histone H1.8 [Tympanuchus pallidicinctus]|uniref:histone H1.8 n=1 Tax=Tympanuchus pallidicinctus TaxID=109042 RepID=UPI0022872A0A|nr:histone H1.8 [Tympanuchus pallidicinctus]
MESQPAKAAGAARLSSLLARGRRSRHPPTLHMVLEALQAQDGKKGASVVAIKRFILAKYPTVDPVRLKYLLKRALATGLSRGFLVRPQNSAALGATGRFKLAPKRLQQKQAQGQEDPGEGPAPKTGRRGAAEAARAPAVARSDGGQGTAKEEPKAVKRRPRAKPADAQPAVEKPRSQGVKAHRAPGKGRLQPPAAPAASGVREDGADRPAGVKRPKKAPAAKSKGKVPEEAQEAASKKGGKAKARKPQAALGAGQGGKAGAQEAAPGRKVS